MKAYYKQLVEGCGDARCRHPLCAGALRDVYNIRETKISDSSARILALRLDEMNHDYFCENINTSFTPSIGVDKNYQINYEIPPDIDKGNKRPYPIVITAVNTKCGQIVHKLREMVPPNMGKSFYEFCCDNIDDSPLNKINDEYG